MYTSVDILVFCFWMNKQNGTIIDKHVKLIDKLGAIIDKHVKLIDKLGAIIDKLAKLIDNP